MSTIQSDQRRKPKPEAMLKLQREWLSRVEHTQAIAAEAESPPPSLSAASDYNEDLPRQRALSFSMRSVSGSSFCSATAISARRFGFVLDVLAERERDVLR